MPNSTSPETSGTATGQAARQRQPTMPDQETLKADTKHAMDRAKEDLGSVAGKAEEQVSELADEARRQVDRAADRMRGVASEQKNLFADQVGDVADAIDRMAGDLEEKDSATAGYARGIAHSAQRFSETVRSRDVDELVGMAQDFGRRQPAAFIGAAALLGFAASRFLMASANRPRPADSMGTSMPSGAMPSTPRPSTPRPSMPTDQNGRIS